MPYERGDRDPNPLCVGGVGSIPVGGGWGLGVLGSPAPNAFPPPRVHFLRNPRGGTFNPDQRSISSNAIETTVGSIPQYEPKGFDKVSSPLLWMSEHRNLVLYVGGWRVGMLGINEVSGGVDRPTLPI